MVFFKNREEAGIALAKKINRKKQGLSNPIILGIPRGGVPVGYQISRRLGAPLDVVVARKLPIPSSPEAGFGAVALDRTVVFNQELLARLYLSKSAIESIVGQVDKEVRRRDKVYRKNKEFPDLFGRSVIIIDDGLASGYTALAAIRFCRKQDPKQIVVASSVAQRQAYEMIKRNSNKTVVLHISNRPYFAVASFYEEFPEMSDEEVIGYLK